MPLSVGKVRQMMVGLDREVPLLNGTTRQYVNLDNAATTPPFQEVVHYIEEFLQWYSSVHRGTGFKSLVSTHLYNRCREVVAEFVSADPEQHAIIFTYNTTGAINKLCYRLPLNNDQLVLCTVMEHHSNLLPWCFKGKVDFVGINNEDGSLDMDQLGRKLYEHKGKVRLVAITGASNITGFMPPLREIARLTHQHGAQLLVDAAQLIAHRSITMGNGPDDPERIDFLAFSAHKMYAPFGSGVLVGPKKFFEQGVPNPVGGGAVELVTLDEVEWASVPEKEEAGTPNLIGVVALAKAIQILKALGMENIAAHERQLTTKALQRLADIPGIRLYGERDSALKRDRVGVIPLLADRINHALLAAILSYEWGIGVRHGCFCAHPYIEHLFEISQEELGRYINQIRRGDLSGLPGFVRISLGVYNTADEIEYLAQALEHILTKGFQGKYREERSTGEYFPEDFNVDFNLYFRL